MSVRSLPFDQEGCSAQKNLNFRQCLFGQLTFRIPWIAAMVGWQTTAVLSENGCGEVSLGRKKAVAGILVR